VYSCTEEERQKWKTRWKRTPKEVQNMLHKSIKKTHTGICEKEREMGEAEAKTPRNSE